jgi:hypothetical protein
MESEPTVRLSAQLETFLRGLFKDNCANFARRRIGVSALRDQAALESGNLMLERFWWNCCAAANW